MPDDRVSVIDLVGGPKVVQQVTAGAGATSVDISPNGSLALVANRTEGTVSAFRLNNKKLEALDKVDLGNPKAGPSGLAFVSDRVALVSRDGDNMINVLRIDGNKVTLDPRPLTTGVRPYTLAIASSGNLAAVSNMGRGDGDIDTVSLIDVSSEPFRTVETISVGMVAEGLRFSPDGSSWQWKRRKEPPRRTAHRFRPPMAGWRCMPSTANRSAKWRRRRSVTGRKNCLLEEWRNDHRAEHGRADAGGVSLRRPKTYGRHADCDRRRTGGARYRVAITADWRQRRKALALLIAVGADVGKPDARVWAMALCFVAFRDGRG